jgi:hypothetical protein
VSGKRQTGSTSKGITARDESEIFSDLANLCSSPGYIHVVAYLCYRDDTISYAEKITVDDMLKQYSSKRLLRTEISILLRLCCESEMLTEIPHPDFFQDYINKTDALLEELHYSMVASFPDISETMGKIDNTPHPLTNGRMLREAIFYGGESAHPFQYREFSQKKYVNDDAWFTANKGFSVHQSCAIMKAIEDIQNRNINDVLSAINMINPDNITLLPAYAISPEEVSEETGVELLAVESFLEAFLFPQVAPEFQSVDDFNQVNSTPIIKINKEYFIFQSYSLLEAMYETPFFWFKADKSYCETANRHRGDFTEDFSAERLKLVFGDSRVFENVNIYDAKGSLAGEIDVLVIYGDRALIVQAKSKKLTVVARKGSEQKLRADFKIAVQDAYNQACRCADLLNNKLYKLTDKNGKEICINREYADIYPICIVSDHYPALSFQARHFLEINVTEHIKPPFVMDIFFLDVATEMLQSPLHFMSYIARRTSYGEKILSTFEMTILSYHLKKNLWVEDDYSIYLSDDVCAELDIAMRTRREGTEGIDVPEGILTKYKGTYFEYLIGEIDEVDDPVAIDLGFILLSLDGKTVEAINDGVSHILRLGREDGNNHDITLAFGVADTGITIHCNDEPIEISEKRLETHCIKRKYLQRASSWYGLCIGISQPSLRYSFVQKYEWVQEDKMDTMVKDMPISQNIKGKRKVNFATITRMAKKIGRNERCPCGSGKKYKFCCVV